MRIGYARVSSTRTDRQDHDTQVRLLEEAGCERILTERGSGARNDRPVMMEVMDLALGEASEGRQADVVVVRLDRWGRSLQDVLASLKRLEEGGVGFISLSESIDVTKPAGKLALSVLGAAAEYERNILRERIIEAKRVKGPSAIGGRPRLMTDANVRLAERMGSEGLSANEIARQLGVSKSTLTRALRRVRLATPPHP